MLPCHYLAEGKVRLKVGFKCGEIPAPSMGTKIYVCSPRFYIMIEGASGDQILSEEVMPVRMASWDLRSQSKGGIKL